MTPVELLYIVKIIALPMWILMVILPGWKVTRKLIDRKTIPNVMFSMYLIYLFISLQNGATFSFGSLGSVIELVTIENGFLALKVLFHSWDLMIGMWILSKAKESHLSHLLIIPCLITTYYVAPLGFLLFITVRWISNKSLSAS